MKKTICENCGYKWSVPPDVIGDRFCKICIRAEMLHSQIYHIVGQDGPISTYYKLIIHPEVFAKFKLIKDFSNKPGKYNKTHIYKDGNKYMIKLQQRWFDSPTKSELIFHTVEVILNKNIFWWYMMNVK